MGRICLIQYLFGARTCEREKRADRVKNEKAIFVCAKHRKYILRRALLIKMMVKIPCECRWHLKSDKQNIESMHIDVSVCV